MKKTNLAMITIALFSSFLVGCNEDNAEKADFKKIKNCVSTNDPATKEESCAAMNGLEKKILDCSRNGSKRDHEACKGLSEQEYNFTLDLEVMRRKPGTTFNLTTRKLGE